MKVFDVTLKHHKTGEIRRVKMHLKGNISVPLAKLHARVTNPGFMVVKLTPLQ